MDGDNLACQFISVPSAHIFVLDTRSIKARFNRLKYGKYGIYILHLDGR
jgi:hypothetical protein